MDDEFVDAHVEGPEPLDLLDPIPFVPAEYEVFMFGGICAVGIKFFGDGALLMHRWRNTIACQDGNISMILGEWIQENRDDLVALGSPPGDVDLVIAYLARRAHDGFHNRSNEWVKSGGLT